MKRFQAQEDSAQLTEEERETIETLLNYPSLEKVFDAADPRRLEATKQSMHSRITELERIVRGGKREEADRSAKIIAAYRTTIGFLDELDQARKNQSK